MSSLTPQTETELRDWPKGEPIAQSDADRLRKLFPAAWEIDTVHRSGNVITFRANTQDSPETGHKGLAAARKAGLNGREPDTSAVTPEAAIYYVQGMAAAPSKSCCPRQAEPTAPLFSPEPNMSFSSPADNLTDAQIEHVISYF